MNPKSVYEVVKNPALSVMQISCPPPNVGPNNEFVNIAF